MWTLDQAITEKIAAAYPLGVEPRIRRFFAWEPMAAERHAATEAARKIAREINEKSEAARLRALEARRRLADLEAQAAASKRDSALRRERASVAAALLVEPNTAMSIRAEDEITGIDAEIALTRRSAAAAEGKAAPLRTLAALADVIAGLSQPTERLARDLGVELWEIGPPHERAAGRRKTAEERDAQALPEREAERRALRKRIAEIEAATAR